MKFHFFFYSLDLFLVEWIRNIVWDLEKCQGWLFKNNNKSFLWTGAMHKSFLDSDKEFTHQTSVLVIILEIMEIPKNNLCIFILLWYKMTNFSFPIKGFLQRRNQKLRVRLSLSLIYCNFIVKCWKIIFFLAMST